MVRIALAGFAQGYYAVLYTRYLSRLKGLEIIGICDLGRDESYVYACAALSAKEFASELAVPLYHDYGELLAQKPDALILCSETWKHIEMAVLAVRQGIHTFVSKPLCFTVSQLCKTEQLMREDTCLLCGNPLKYEEGLIELCQRLKSGEIGTVYSLRIMVNHLAMTEQEWERDPEKSGGPLGTYGVYLFDIARWLTGKPIMELVAYGGNYANSGIRAADTVKILGIQSDGAQCLFELYSGIRHAFPFVQVEAIGDKGVLMTNNWNYAVIGQTADGIKPGRLRSSDMAAGEMEHFLDCVLHGTQERCGLSDMVYVARCIDAVTLSTELHEFVRIGGD